MKRKTFTADHSGSLEDCLKTEKPITYEMYWQLVVNGIYEFYGYDERIKAQRYILKEHWKNIGLPTWVHYYTDKKKPNWEESEN